MSESRPAILVSLREFLRTGNFGGIEFGISREELTELLGPTEMIAKGNRRDRYPSIYKYGDFEFYVHPDENRLHLIFSDYFSVPQGDSTLVIDPWILRNDLSVEDMEQALQTEKIGYQISETEDARYLLCDSGLKLGFMIDSQIEGKRSVKRCLWLIQCSRIDVLPEREPERQINVTVTKTEIDLLRRLAQKERISVGKLCTKYVRLMLLKEGEND